MREEIEPFGIKANYGLLTTFQRHDVTLVAVGETLRRPNDPNPRRRHIIRALEPFDRLYTGLWTRLKRPLLPLSPKLSPLRGVRQAEGREEIGLIRHYPQEVVRLDVRDKGPGACQYRAKSEDTSWISGLRISHSLKRMGFREDHSPSNAQDPAFHLRGVHAPPFRRFAHAFAQIEFRKQATCDQDLFPIRISSQAEALGRPEKATTKKVAPTMTLACLALTMQASPHHACRAFP